MTIQEINPFVRYAGKLLPRTYPNFGYASDWRLFYFFQGRCRMNISGRTVAAEPFSLIVIPPFTGYQFSNIEHVGGIVINFDMDQANAARTAPYALIGEPSEQYERVYFTDYPALNEPMAVEHYGNSQKTATDILKEFEYRKLYFREQASAMLKSVLFELIRFRGTNNNVSAEKAEIILGYIAANYKHDPDCREIAEQVHYHPNYVNQLIKLYTGKSLKSCVTDAKINAAKQLLIATALPVCEIASETGFHDPAYFSNFFKQVTGLSPTEYRKRNYEVT